MNVNYNNKEYYNIKIFKSLVYKTVKTVKIVGVII